MKAHSVTHLLGIPAADRCESFVIIGARVSPQDLSPVRRKYIAGAARKRRVPAQHTALFTT